jgi:RNA polymerase sigma factor (sigma-70 family)
MSEAAAPLGFAPGVGMLSMLSDDRLAQRAVGGDERAFAAIYHRYHQSLYRFCLAIVGDAQDAQDALQSTMVKVLRALPGEERRIELRPWLYRIAHNESIDLLRRRRVTGELPAELPAPGAGLAEEVAVRERLRRLIADLDELPERQRETLVMRELAGLDFAEIGAALGTSSAVARQTVYEARLSLRQMDEGREMSCETVTRALSDGDGRVARRRDVRAHLRTCAACRSFREGIEGRRQNFAALSPLPAVAAAGLLQSLLGGHAAAGGGLAAALGGGAAKSVATSAALKGVATVAVVAAVGAAAADRGGLIDVGLPGDNSSQATPAEYREVGGDGLSTGGAGSSGAALHPGARVDGRSAASQETKNAAGAVTGAGAGTAGPATNADGSSPAGTRTSSGSGHPHGRGHEKSLPGASAHGQQTAAAHKGAKHGSAGAKSHAAEPTKPSHPAHPSNPDAGEKEASKSPSGGGAQEHPQERSPQAGSGTQAAPVPPPAGGAEESSSGSGAEINP